MATSIQDALRRYGAMYGSAWRGGVLLSNAIEVSGAVELNRIEVRIVGLPKNGYKPGLETREGTIRINQIDTSWQIDFFKYLDARRRRMNGEAISPVLPTFSLKLQVNDPDAFDREVWTLNGCQIWRLPLGFSATDDLIDREFPMTWEEEDPTSVFSVNPQGQISRYNGQTIQQAQPFPPEPSPSPTR